ncbi:MAG: hypothetical protein ACFFFB_02255 [Candidatus Heimdallarchaeota archaeon]
MYKVIFNGTEEEEEEGLTLVFKEFDASETFNIHQKYFSSLKNLSQISPHIISFQNIREVIKIGDKVNEFTINYYVIILFISKKDNKKEGFLIGNIRKKGDILLGIWPFKKESKSLTIDDIKKVLNSLISKPQNFSKICLIYS